MLARLSEAALAAAMSPELRERVRLAEAGELGDCDALVLVADLEALARLLGKQDVAGRLRDGGHVVPSVHGKPGSITDNGSLAHR
jgi:hypothetical protein